MTTSSKRKIQDRAEAEALLAEWEASGLAFRAFCNRKDIDGRSLHCWRMTLDRGAADAPVQLVELTPIPVETTAIYRIRIGSALVEVDDAFRADTLARLSHPTQPDRRQGHSSHMACPGPAALYR